MALGTQTSTERPTTERERLSSIEAVLPHLATKADVADVKVEVERVRIDIERMQANMIKWHIGTAIAIIGAVFAIVRFLG